MLDKVETIPDYLGRIWRNKGELRSTQEVAEYFDLSNYRARKYLENYSDLGFITGYDRCWGVLGAPYLWGPPTNDGDDDGGEPMPINDNELGEGKVVRKSLPLMG